MVVCGHLHKQGEDNKAWRRRWFIINDGSLYYFREVLELTPISQVSLRGAAQPSRSDEGCELTVPTADRKLQLRAPDLAKCEQWRTVLSARNTPMAGFLEKRGQFNTQFKRRWFVFDPDGDLLSYFHEPPEVAPVGMIPLERVRNVPRAVASVRPHRDHACASLTTTRCGST